VTIRLGCLAVALVLAMSGCTRDQQVAREATTAPRTTEMPACEEEPKPPADGVVVTIFHETHTHGHLAGTHDRPRHVMFARYVGLIDALRDRCLREPANSLFLGNGDDLGVDLNGVITEGRHTVDAFNAAGIDADTFGFGELEVLGVLRERVADSRFPWVSANVREAKNPEQVYAADQGARPWIIQDVGGVRVGITGLLGTRFNEEGFPLPGEVESELHVLDPVRTMRHVVPEMRAQGAQIVVLLSHMIHEDTLRVIRSVDGIDVALGTHLGEATTQAEKVNGTIVAVAGPDEMQGLGQLDLVIRDGRIVDYTWRRHLPSPADPVDAEVEAALAEYAP
jgi:2',3'-cyclic-nucleotide 2'-phosphodiesterase (5'-nucleotidase family)